MVAIGRNKKKYWEICTSVRLTPDLPPKKIYIQYIGKDPRHIVKDGIRWHTAGKQHGVTMQEKIEKVKHKIKSMTEAELYSDSTVKEYRRQEWEHAMATAIGKHGALNPQHFRWMRETLKVEEPNLYDLDTFFKEKISTKDKISQAIMNLTSEKGKEYIENLVGIDDIKKKLENAEDKQVHTGSLSGYGGAFDETKAGTDGEFKRDESYAEGSVSESIKELKRNLLMLEHKNKEFEKINKKELKILGEYVKLNKMNDIKMSLDIENDHRHHIDDIMDVYVEAKRYKALQIAKLKFGQEATTDEQKIKLTMINEEAPIEHFTDLQNIYCRTIIFDYASDMIDKKVLNPIAMRSWENGKTKQFLNKCFKLGIITREFVEREKGNTKIHYAPNVIDMIYEGKSNLLRKYSGISKASMARLVNHETLDYVKYSIIDTNKLAQEMDWKNKQAGIKTKKNARTFKQLLGVHMDKLQELGIKNKKEFGFMMSLCSDDGLRDSCRNVLNIMKISDIYKPNDVLKTSAKQVMKSYDNKVKKKEKPTMTQEQIETERQMREFYGENWREFVLN